MAREDEAPLLAIDSRELTAPQVEDTRRVGDGVGGAVHVAEEWRVIEDPLHGDLDQRAMARLEQIGDVVAHEGAVVEEAVGLQDVRGPDVHVPGRRPVAGGAHAKLIGEDPELRAHHGFFLRRVEAVHRLVDVAVGADLVAGFLDPERLRAVVLHGPARDEERRREPQLVEHPEDPVDPDSGPEAPLLETRQAPPGLVRLPEEEPGLGVEIE